MLDPEFNAWALAQGTVCKTDGTFCGECVSFINQYLSKVHNIQAGAWGHAKAWASPNHPIRQWFYPVSKSQAGDIGVSIAGEFGHIWKYRDNDIIEQNGRVARKVTISPDRNATVILRPKAGMPQAPKPRGEDMINADQVKDLYRVFLGREASQQEANNWVGTWQNAFYGIKDSAEGQAYRAKQAAERAVAEANKTDLAAAKAALAAANKALAEAQAKSTEDSQLLDAGGSFLKKLLKRLGF